MPPRRRDSELAQPRRASRSTPTTVGKAIPPTIPEVDEDWHPRARMMFESAFTGGVSTEFWEDGDWALHYTLCATYSDALNAGNLKAFLLDTLLNGWKSLGITVGSRATMRLELRAEEPAGDTSQWEIVRLSFLEKKGKPMTEAEKTLLEANRHRLAS